MKKRKLWKEPFRPHTMTECQVAAIEQAAQAILDARQKYTDQGWTLAMLYDPDRMPADLAEAHQNNDRAVDAAYGFTEKNLSGAERLRYLFRHYQWITSPQKEITA